ncbi:ATP-binding protein [Frigoribacterium sp. 2-23]|uniref:ATP-binding protein n=1 Tax=Frigoribacterium sp. 2-23 TaxID=3415006 RepID=UPI003C6EE3C7
MKRGRLRVLLGAAPGVGKTYTMLEEGARLGREGKDVVVAIVETHGRAATASMLQGLEVVPRASSSHRGVELDEMDLEAVLARRPDVALVDELAHTNAPGSAHEKRWQDVQTLLDAGISVMSTVNVQHVESLNDVVEKITGVPQRETVPDSVLRAADQIEVVDLAPQALRDRLAEGNVYPAERVDAALSNYFRLGNLTALRELALLWLADEVDSALNAYRDEHGIDSAWEARERVVVALTGGPEGETLIRRGARIAARSAGGQVIAVHVTTQDGLRQGTPGALAVQRTLVEKLGGTYHQTVGDDVPEALVQFAKSMNATQLVLGVSRRGRLAAALTGPGIGATVIRESGAIDVHIVTHTAAGGRFTLPRVGGSLSVKRRIAGFVLALTGGPLMTALLVALRNDDTIASDVLAFQLLVVVVALVGGIWPALFAALLSGITLDFFFVQPFYSVTVAQPTHLIALGLYVANAMLVSYVVDQAARRSRSAARALAETELLTTVAGGVLRGQGALEALIQQARDVFGLHSVRVVQGGEVVAATGDRDEAGTRDEAGARDEAGSSGETGDFSAAPPVRTAGAKEVRSTPPAPVTREPATTAAVDREPATPAPATPAPTTALPVTTLAVGPDAQLELEGKTIGASERRLLGVVAAQVEAALEHGRLSRTADEVAPLEQVDRMRSALLAAVGHDLRRPLAAATTAISGLRQHDVTWTDADRDELLATAYESLESLTALVTNLLDVSRVQAGALAVSTAVVDLDDVVTAALDELSVGPERVDLDLVDETPAVLADAVLLQRVVVNLLDNALKYSPAGGRVRIATSEFADRVELRVVDTGPGVPADRRDEVFAAFQRLGDTDNTTGLGLGLALSRGFVEAMQGTLEMDDTPGGGLTTVVSLPAAPGRDRPAPPELDRTTDRPAPEEAP